MMKRPPVRRVTAFLFVVLCVWMQGGLLGCQASSTVEELAARVADADLSTQARIKALDALTRFTDAEGNAIEGDEHWQILARAAWVDRQPLELRVHAFNAMRKLDAARLSEDAVLLIPSVTSWSARTFFIESVGEQEWTHCMPAVIRSWQQPVRGVEDRDRPERMVLETLTGMPAEKVLLDCVCGQGGGMSGKQLLAEQTAAWIALARWRGRDQAKALIQQSSAADASLGHLLQSAGAVLDIWPTTREQVAWLALVSSNVLNSLPAGDLPLYEGMALRHLAMTQRIWPTDNLLATGIAHIASYEPVQRDQDASGWRPELTRVAELSEADLAAVAMIRLAVEQPGVRAALFAQAMDDRADPKAEHGGVLRITPDGGIEAHRLSSRHAVNDERYVPPKSLLLELQHALAQYHFHAQAYENASLAGPGKADLAFAEAFGCSCLVVTWIDRDTLNIDWFTQGGRVVDLGMIQRQ